MPSSGPHSPGTLANDSSNGEEVAWSNPSNAASSNDSYAIAELDSGQESHYLKATNFGVSVPTGRAILGVEVAVERSAEFADNINDLTVRLVVGVGLQGNNKASAAFWPTTDGTATYGGAADKWGVDGLTEDVVESSNFGVVIAVDGGFGGGVEARIDHITLTVHYADAGDIDEASTTTPSGSLSMNIDTSYAGAVTPTGTLSLVSVTDNSVKIVKGGTISGSEMAAAGSWPDSDVYASYGGPSNLWGVALTPADVNASNFGAVFSARAIGGSAEVDHIRMTVFYDLPANFDPTSLLVVGEIDSTRMVSTPQVYQLARANLSPSNDPNIAKALDNATITFSRQYAPSRSVEKLYRAVEFYLEMSPQADTPGFQMWASVDDGTYFQLTDSSGNGTLRTSGSKVLYFPKTTAAAGHWVQLQGRIPAKSAGEVDVACSIRGEITIRVFGRSRRGKLIRVPFILTDGQTESPFGGMMRSIAEQKAELEELAAPGTAVVPYVDTNGATGWLVVEDVEFREATNKGEIAPPSLIAILSLRKAVYDD